MKIEWASHIREDGSKRRPPPSTMHGWLAKLRGTLIGNENLRSKGMREMQEAKARKRYFAKQRQQRSASSGTGAFSFLGFGKSKKPQSHIRKSTATSPRPSHRSRNSSRAGQSSVKSPGKPAPRHRASGSSHKSYRMPGHYDLSRQRQNHRRSTT